MALAEDEPVAVRVVGMLGIDRRRAPVGRDQDVDAREGRAEVRRPGAMRHLHNLAAQPADSGRKVGGVGRDVRHLL